MPGVHAKEVLFSFSIEGIWLVAILRTAIRRCATCSEDGIERVMTHSDVSDCSPRTNLISDSSQRDPSEKY